MAKHRFLSEQQINFLKKNAPGKYWKDIAQLFNERFKTDYSPKQIYLVCRYHGIKNGMGKDCRHQVKYTQEIINYIRDIAPGLSPFSVTLYVNRQFNTNFKEQYIKRAMWLNGIRTGAKRGCPPRRLCGNEFIAGRGFIKIKVGEITGKNGEIKNVYKQKHILLWEQAHGQVPKGHNVIFLDGNKNNFEIDNLALASIVETRLLHQYGLISNDKNITSTGLAIVRHKLAINKKIKESKEAAISN